MCLSHQRPFLPRARRCTPRAAATRSSPSLIASVFHSRNSAHGTEFPAASRLSRDVNCAWQSRRRRAPRIVASMQSQTRKARNPRQQRAPRPQALLRPNRRSPPRMPARAAAQRARHPKRAVPRAIPKRTLTPPRRAQRVLRENKNGRGQYSALVNCTNLVASYS